MNLRSITAISALALVSISAGQAVAQNGPLFELGYADVQDISGGELGVGWRFNAKNIHLTPVIGGFIYQGEQDRYYIDHMSSGRSQCRDSTNGQFAKKEYCNDGEIAAYGRLEATVHYRKLEGGIGYHVSEFGERAYGTLSWSVSPNVAIKANAGQEYYGLSLVLR